ncbi:TRAP-type C4-dicarboxylate transport system, small permease component [Variovorax sp. PBS-H4]|uniref:TRAP transporter small permease n=1 Tax=Variovorax sp. PBS-H4 TaxID=434008 RepID=UPI001315FE14|nr:TRAP transporter small permease [Variovorax sp. PBS-H4]VTU29899.1 TRAP-type C4-dicarboxylate transport system, small permease component [Variovorax sp. PBS-H4]
MNAIERLLNRLSTATLVLGAAATLLMMLHVVVDVIARVVFKRPVGGTLETVTYIWMVAVVFLPLAMVQRRRQQIIVELFSQVLPPRVLALLDGIVAAIACCFMLGLTWYSGHEAWAQTLIREAAPSPTSPVPIWPARWMVVAGAGLVAVYLALQSAADLRLAVTGKRSLTADPAPGARLAEV